MIKIKGHSNFVVSIIEYNNKYFISKESDPENCKRLYKQIKKQQNLYEYNFLDNVKVPKIIDIIENEDKSIKYLMEYI